MNMRIKIIIVAILFLLPATTTHAASTINAPATNRLTTGLVGLWTFDGKDTNSTTAFDRSGNANHGTLTNGPTKVIGKLGQGLKFSRAQSTFVDAGTGSSLSIPTTITMSAWVYVDSSNKGGAIISRQGFSGTRYNYVLLNGGPGSDISLWFDSNTGAVTGEITAVNPGIKSGWNHIAGSYDGATEIIYLNGVSVRTEALTYTLGTGSNNTFIGKYNLNSTADELYNGIIDEVRVYNRTLSANEIKQLYNLGAAAKVNAPTTNRLTTGLVGLWTFDGKDTNWTSATAGTAADRSGNGNTGTLTNMSRSSSPTIGRLGQGLKFDGADDYMSTSGTSGASFDVGQSKTVSFWIKTTQVAAAYPVSKYTGASNNGWLFALNNDGCVGTANKITFYSPASTGETCATAQVVSSSNVNDNLWHHVVGVINLAASTNGDRIIYFDGKSEASNSAAGSLVTNSVNVYTANFSNLGSATYFNGSIDEVRVYNRALSAAEVKQLYNMGVAAKVNAPTTNRLTSGLVGLWTFNGKDTNSTTAFDRSGNNNSGTLTNGPTKVIGKLGQGLKFDGVNQYVDVGNESNFDFERTNSFTLSAWIKNSNTADDDFIVAKAQNSVNYTGYYMITNDTTGRLRGYLQASEAALIDVEGTTNILNNAWHHTVMTYSGNSLASGVKLYVDGTLESMTTASDTLGTNSILNNVNVKIGSRDAGGVPYKGSIDDVRVYNRALSAAEVLQLYRLGK